MLSPLNQRAHFEIYESTDKLSMEFEPGTCKLQQRGSRFRSRERVKAMAMAMGVALTITLGLLSLVSSSTALGNENADGHVTRHLRSLLLGQKARGYGTALDQRPLDVSMEATARRTAPQSTGPVGAMEALAKGPVLRKPGAEASMTTSTTSTATESHGRGGGAMEAIVPRYEKKAAPETIADAVAKAEEAEEIAQEALVVALAAENDLEAIEAITETSIFSLATNSITEGLGGEEILIVGEIEDSDDSSDSQEELVARKGTTKKHKGW
ncbi:hypothetical protein P3T76_005243 [Phytophthora citrophthora]|uniref:Uncharacterized protein n=1 Tax=Phytophthora citrophthora TaxID=4793 RepID=A0AAD9GSE8_9STRA|nr:hypothetical protein P3T76_005243 [Phytophthora citrophthora]